MNTRNSTLGMVAAMAMAFADAAHIVVSQPQPASIAIDVE